MESELSFNHFGAENLGKNNEREDYNADYHFEDRPLKGKDDFASSFAYHPEKASNRREDNNNSFVMNNSYRKNHSNNNSFNFGNANKNRSEADLSYVANQPTKSKPTETDFFELLNAEVSPIRESN